MIDKVVADIIETELSVSGDRIVVNNQNFKPPKDSDPWWVILFAGTKIISNSTELDTDTDEQVQQTVYSTRLNLDVKGKSRDTIDAAFATAAALDSFYAQQKMEEEQLQIYRPANPVDLSEVDGASSLHRWRIPVTITHVVIKRASTVPFENFQTPEVLTDEN